MTDAPDEARLVEEHRDELRILGEVRMQSLDRDRAGEPHRSAETAKMHRGHAARCELSVEHVASHRAR